MNESRVKMSEKRYRTGERSRGIGGIDVRTGKRRIESEMRGRRCAMSSGEMGS